MVLATYLEVTIVIREGVKKRPVFVVFYYEGVGVCENAKRLRSFFISYAF